MAGSITVSSITLDSDNNFSIRSNTGATLFSLDGTGVTNSRISGNLSFDSTGTTGIRLPAANTLSFHTAGTEDMRIDSSGNVGIGGTPAQKFNVIQGVKATTAAVTNIAGFVSTDASSFGLFFRQKLDATAANRYMGLTVFDNGVGAANLVLQDLGGDVIVGGTTAINSAAGRGNITINGSSNAILNFGVGGVDQGYIYHNGTDILFDNSKNGFIRFGTNATERMRILSGGAVLVGCTTNPNSTVAGKEISSYFQSSCGTTTTTYQHFYFTNGNGNVGTITTNGSSTAYNTSSDYRLKENVVPMTGALDKVALLKPVTYKWKSDGSNGEGFIAHELAEVVAGCVTGEKDAMRTENYEITPAIPATYDEEGNELTSAVEAVMGEREVPDYQGIDTSFLVATLTAAIQELKAELDATKAEVQALKAK